MSFNIIVPEELIQNVSKQNAIISGHSQLVDVSCQHLDISGTTTINKDVSLDANNGDLIFNNQSISSGGTGQSSILFRSGHNAGSDYGYIQYNDHSSTSSGESARLIIGTKNDSDDHIILSPSGNVGIGTTSPNNKLHVDGNTTLDGNTSIGGTLNVTGTINSNKWNARQILNNKASINFVNNSYTAATNIQIYGGTLIFYVSCGGFTTTGGITNLHFYLKNSNNSTLYTIQTYFYHNQTSTHSSWSKSEVVTGLSAQSIKIIIGKSNNLTCDQNDFFTITLLELPF